MKSRVKAHENIINEIEKEERHQRLIKKTIKFIKIVLILLLICFLVFIYIYFIARTTLLVKEETYKSTKINDDFDGFKIVSFTDLKYSKQYDLKEVKKVVKEINDTNPDLVLFSGNLISNDTKLSNKESDKLLNELKSIKSSVGKYYVLGKNDKDSILPLLNDASFELLNNKKESIYKGNSHIELFGISKDENLNDTTKDLNETNYNILLINNQNSLKNINNIDKFDLVFTSCKDIGQLGINLDYPSFTKYNNVICMNGLGTDQNNYRFTHFPKINFIRITKNDNN